MYNIDLNTGINSLIVKRVKEKILYRENIINENDMELEYAESLSPNDTLYWPVILLVDISLSIKKYRDKLNEQVKNFVKSVAETGSVVRSSIDFCYMTFNEKVQVRKSFGNLKISDIDKDWIELGEDEVGGKTDLASALFAAWYMGEKRKSDLKKEGCKYRQPIIMLISDLKHNLPRVYETVRGKDITVMDITTELLTDKVQGDKLGILETILFEPDYTGYEKSPVYNIDGSYKVDEPQQFSERLKEFFRKLIATVPADGAAYYDDEDDIVCENIEPNNREKSKGSIVIDDFFQKQRKISKKW